jgi:hypothetical protein
MRDDERRWGYQGPTCSEVSLQASAYFDDRLSIPAQMRMTLHLGACIYCRAYVMQISFLLNTLALFPQISPSSINRLRLRQHFAAVHPR